MKAQKISFEEIFELRWAKWPLAQPFVVPMQKGEYYAIAFVIIPGRYRVLLGIKNNHGPALTEEIVIMDSLNCGAGNKIKLAYSAKHTIDTIMKSHADADGSGGFDFLDLLTAKLDSNAVFQAGVRNALNASMKFLQSHPQELEEKFDAYDSARSKRCDAQRLPPSLGWRIL